MNLPILNREFKKPSDDWYQLVPKGEFPGTLEKKTGDVIVVQVVDDAALSAMVKNFQSMAERPNFPGVLVDFDHFSYDESKSSEAAGWIAALDQRPNGLWGKIRWSDLGEAAVSNGRYRMVSPVWLEKDLQAIDGDRMRPTRLDSVAITNNPNMKGMAPLSNRQFSRGLGAEADNKTPNERVIMKTVAAKLGLSAEASEETILAEVTKIANRATEAESKIVPLQSKVTELETINGGLMSDQVEALLSEHGVKEEKLKNRLKPLLLPLKNREARIEFLADFGIKPADGKRGGGQVFNRADTKSPKNGAQEDAGDDQERAAKIKNRASELQGATPNRSWDSCWGQAQKELLAGAGN